MRNVVVKVHNLNFIFAKGKVNEALCTYKNNFIGIHKVHQKGATYVFHPTVDYIHCTIINCKYN